MLQENIIMYSKYTDISKNVKKVVCGHITLTIKFYVLLVSSLQASYGVEDAEFAVIQLAQTTMRSELGMLFLCEFLCI